ncbi:CDP-archaeol synthase [Thiogranum longum]
MLILKLVFLLAIANGTPVLVKRLLHERLAFPLDGGLRFVDGKPLFGASKTVRGLVSAVLVTSAAAPLLGLEWRAGALIGACAMLGDLFSSFIKRRMNLPPSSMALGLDQIPESLFPMLACQPMLGLEMLEIVIVVAVFSVAGPVLSYALFKLRIREHPY